MTEQHIWNYTRERTSVSAISVIEPLLAKDIGKAISQ